MNRSELLASLARCVGERHVLTTPTDTAPFSQDWRRKYRGEAAAVVSPASTAEVAAVLQLAHAQRIPVVTQGGNTGMSGGATPDGSGTQIVLSTRRLNRIRHVDALNDTIEVEAGVVLEAVQVAASEVGRLFPLALAAQGSCTIGGNLATNAGGTAVLRYGNARDLALGLEVVTPDGRIWNGLRGLRKDNTGYDLKQLYIGSEGTLGVITAAVLMLFPPPAARRTAMLTLPSIDNAVQLLNRVRAELGPALTAFEVISAACVPVLQRHFPAMRWPFETLVPVVALIETSDHESEAHARDTLAFVLEQALEDEIATDGVIGESVAQSRALWTLREHLSEAQALEGSHIKHDIAVPISRVAAFVDAAVKQLQRGFPGARMAWFGHLGDGNLHFNVLAPVDADPQAFCARQDEVNRLVHDLVQAHSGSISAEHGLGQLRRDESARYKDSVELALMQGVKQALDPLGLMNPGKVLGPMPEG
ncbi:FAD-binding oxidoreductase [Hydrogenophaga sp. BPS33]|uniref:FAD-binding oxidoreductase n=1 Tax=Hydrogenophaga sp. BPS33 TaxID=2651974 RepID=UPI00131FC78C|nr:FAD-binding oxidoreductase [Hydrogenophaga sp. BPS33]QHE83462.1 FAD-binding oxidoreductase [Hydrogenophaga sp. BPS33]